jgi:hypothetical protein
MQIRVNVIPHNEQRYETLGDWWFDEEGTLQIRVSSMDNEDYENCIAIHEQIEAILCKKRGITEKQVSDWDKQFEEAREKYPDIFGDNEPGDHPKAPYNNEHMFASRVEHSIAQELGIDWAEYNRVVNEL